MDFQQIDELSLPFVDQEHARLLPEPTINSYPQIPTNPINFSNMFDLDPSENLSSQSQSNFFSQNHRSIKQSRPELTIYLRQSLGGLKTRKKTIHNIPPVNLMKEVHNVTLPNNYPELVNAFLTSEYFSAFIKLIVLVNLLGIFLTDYSFRAEATAPSRLSKINAVSLCLQLFANCVFTLEIGMKLYQNDDKLRNAYLYFNLGGTLATWISIFFNMVDYDSNILFTLIMLFRILRAMIRIMEVFQCLRVPFEVFLRTVPSLQKLFFPFIILTLLYALTGMALYGGSSYYLCQKASEGVASYSGYCGSSLYSCPTGQQCVKVNELPAPAKWNQYNLINFESIGNALLTVHHFVYNTNFSLTRGRFTYFINPYISTLFFISISIIFFYIFSNLIMISMSKAYMHEILNQKSDSDDSTYEEISDQEETTFTVKVAQVFNFIIILAQSIVIAATFSTMGQKFQQLQSLLDFSLSWISLVIIAFLVTIQKEKYFRGALNWIDIGCMLCHLVDLVICAALGESVIYSQNEYSLVLRSLKVVRIIRILYISDNIFTYEKFVIWVFKKTIFKVKYFLLLCLCFALMFKQMGQLLFAFKIRFDQFGNVDILNGRPYINNFQSFSNSLYTVSYLFLNENWSSTMYQYYAAVGWQAVLFFVAVAFIAYMMLVRLYIAVFLSYFREELSKKSKQELSRENHQKIESLQESIKKRTVSDLREHERNADDASQDEEQRVSKTQGCCSWPILKSIFHSHRFYYFINGMIILHCLTVIVRSSSDSNSKTKLLSSLENICLGVYILQVIFGCLIEGIYLPPQSYLKRNKSNVISFGVAVLSFLAFIPFGNGLANLYLCRITIIKIFTFFRETDKNMTVVIDTIGQIITKFFKFLFIYALFLFMAAVIPLKFLNQQTEIFNCQLGSSNNLSADLPSTEQECLKIGGTWFSDQNFSDIFSALALFYQLASSQSWSAWITSLIQHKKTFGWELFFIVYYFIYNICFLNIMMGFIVETYMHLKDKAYNLNLLKQSQKCWILIKNSIHCLVPTPILTLPSRCSSQQQFFFTLITHENYTTFMDYLPYINAALYLFGIYGQQSFYTNILQYLKNAVMFCFLGDVSLKIYALRRKFFDLPNSTIQLTCGMMIVVYSLSSWLWDLGYELQHIMDFLLVCSLLLRCKSLLFKYAWCKTNINSVIDILPKCGTIIKLACALLFFYAALGMELFRNVKPGFIIDNYNIGYNNFLTSILTLVRISVAEAWYQVISAFLKHSIPSNICYTITNEAEAEMYKGQGCGSWLAYPYFLSFHIAMVLLVLNLLIATMASAYDDNYEIEYNSVNIFQLQDCLNLWQKYDPHATGVVHYKKFWRLTSEIAILFGISKKKLIKRKNKFFEELDLQIYQEKRNPIMCYRFHDVITKFSKIKLQVANLSTKTQGENEVDIEFDINPAILAQIKDFTTPFPDHMYTMYHPFKQYTSKETKYVFGLLKKIRHWKHLSTEKKRLAGGTKLSSIFDIKSKKQSRNELIDRDQFKMPQDL